MPGLGAIHTPSRGLRNRERLATMDVGHVSRIAESTIRKEAGTATPFACGCARCRLDAPWWLATRSSPRRWTRPQASEGWRRGGIRLARYCTHGGGVVSSRLSRDGAIRLARRVTRDARACLDTS